MCVCVIWGFIGFEGNTGRFPKEGHCYYHDSGFNGRGFQGLGNSGMLLLSFMLPALMGSSNPAYNWKAPSDENKFRLSRDQPWKPSKNDIKGHATPLPTLHTQRNTHQNLV